MSNPLATASQVPKSTNTPLPSSTTINTHHAATATLTPSSTPFPTFNPNNVVTHTPAPPAQCPAENPEFVVQLDENRFWDYGNRLNLIQETLDEGASLQQVADAVNEISEKEYGRAVNIYPLLDLNGDGVQELVVDQLLSHFAFGCDNGGYRIILDYYTVDGGHGDTEIVAVEDMNLDSTPEIVLIYSVGSGGDLQADILEWNGREFVSLVRSNLAENAEITNSLVRALYWYDLHHWWYPLPTMNGWADVEILDIDNNGTKELILKDDGPLQ
jgi:hypothetical protein